MVLFHPGAWKPSIDIPLLYLGLNVQTWKNSLYTDQIVSPVAHAAFRIAVINCVRGDYGIAPRDT
jgi:hypothetical protein